MLAGIAVLGVIALAGCSAASTAGTSAPGATAAAATPAAASAPADASAPAAETPAAPPASGGGATDFCAAWAEYQDARNADTTRRQAPVSGSPPQTCVRPHRAEIAAAAGLLADVLDEFGQSMVAGGAQPETLGQGQSPERQKGVQDSVAWITKNCP